MRVGDLIRIPDSKHSYDSIPLMEQPPNTSMLNGTVNPVKPTGIFLKSHTGIVLESKELMDVFTRYKNTWIRVLGSGGTGWMKKIEIEVVE